MESISKLFIQFQESLSPQVKEENRDKYKWGQKYLIMKKDKSVWD
jgi:hypothetical protein